MVLVLPTDAERLRHGGATENVWSFILEPVSEHTTRFVMLSLAAKPKIADLLFWESAHFVMERKMMLTIKRLAEQLAASV